jgi:hypothetical protein
MRKKSGMTMVEQAIMLVPEFKNVVRKLEQQVTLRGQSKSTLNNYIRRIALFVIHFGKLPVILNYQVMRHLFAAPTWLPEPGVHHCNYRQQDIPPGESGKTSVIPANTFILFTSLARPLRASSPTVSNVPCENKMSLPFLTGRCRQHIKPRGWHIANHQWQVLNILFTLHILPKRFVKIRRYGIYNHTVKRNMDLRFTPGEKSNNKPKEKSQVTETNLQRFERLTGVNLCLCPGCKTGKMITLRELPRIRSPGLVFSYLQTTHL